MGKVKLILGEMSFEEFEAKCNEVLAMMLKEGEMSEEEAEIAMEVNAIWLNNGGHETVKELLSRYPDRQLMSDEQIDEFGILAYDAVCDWIKDIL